MKYFLIILMGTSFNIFSADHKKLDPIIFMLDLSVISKSTEKQRSFHIK